MLSHILVGMLALLAVQEVPTPDDRESEAEGEVACLALAHNWSGTNEDNRQIETQPVPVRFRQQFEGGGCGRFQLVWETLIDWHLDFGNERSVIAALAYLEQDFLREAPEPQAYARELRGALRQTSGELNRLERSQPTDTARTSRHLQRIPPVLRLQQLTSAHQSFIALAEQYLRAAEFHNSVVPYDRARQLLDAAQGTVEFLYGAESRSSQTLRTINGGFFGIDDQIPERLLELEIGLALQHARMTRSPADIDAAGLLIERHFTPLLRSAVSSAYRAGSGFCDFDNNDGEAAETALRTACDEEPYFPNRVLRFWRNQAHLDLLRAAEPEYYEVVQEIGPPANWGSSAYSRRATRTPVQRQAPGHGWWFDRVITMHRRARDDGGLSGLSFQTISADIVRLQLALADSSWRSAQWLRSQNDGRLDAQIADIETSALDAIHRAAAYAPPEDAPRRFAQLATRYMEYFRSIMATRRGEPNSHPIDAPRFARQAVYFDQLLQGLDRIATGDLRHR